METKENYSEQIWMRSSSARLHGLHQETKASLEVQKQGRAAKHRGRVYPSHPAILGLILGIPRIYFDVAEIDRHHECGKLKNVDQTIWNKSYKSFATKTYTYKRFIRRW